MIRRLALAFTIIAVAGCADFFVPKPQAAKPTKTTMFVLNGKGKTLDRIELSTGAVTKGVFSTGDIPNQIHVSGTTGYLVSSGENKVVKIDLTELKEVGKLELPVKANPMTLASYGENKAILVNYLEKSAVFFDLGTMALEASASVPAGQPGGGIAVSGGKAYVAAVTADYSNYPQIGFSFSGVHVYDLQSRAHVKTIALPNDADPLPVAKDPDGKIHVGVSNGVTTIDPASDTVVRTIDFGTKVNSIAIIDAEKAFAAAGGNGLVSFNPKTGAILRSLSNKIAAGDTSVGNFKVHGKGIYVPNFASDSVTVIDLATETASGTPFKVGSGPQEVAFVEVEQ